MINFCTVKLKHNGAFFNFCNILLCFTLLLYVAMLGPKITMSDHCSDKICINNKTISRYVIHTKCSLPFFWEDPSK